MQQALRREILALIAVASCGSDRGSSLSRDQAPLSKMPDCQHPFQQRREDFMSIPLIHYPRISTTIEHSSTANQHCVVTYTKLKTSQCRRCREFLSIRESPPTQDKHGTAQVSWSGLLDSHQLRVRDAALLVTSRWKLISFVRLEHISRHKTVVAYNSSPYCTAATAHACRSFSCRSRTFIRRKIGSST